MKEIELLEEELQAPVEKWTIDDIAKLGNNSELIQILKNSDVMTELLSRSKHNRDIANLFVPLYIKAKLNDAEEYTNDILGKYENKAITKDELFNKLMDMINDESFYFKLAGYLILISLFSDTYDAKKDEIVIKECISNIKEIVIGFVENDLASTYTLIMDLLEILFPVRQKYFDKYQIDVLDDEDQRFYNALDKIHQFEYQVQEELYAKYDELAKSNPDIKAILDKEDKGEVNE